MLIIQITMKFLPCRLTNLLDIVNYTGILINISHNLYIIKDFLFHFPFLAIFRHILWNENYKFTY